MYLNLIYISLPLSSHLELGKIFFIKKWREKSIKKISYRLIILKMNLCKVAVNEQIFHLFLPLNGFTNWNRATAEEDKQEIIRAICVHSKMCSILKNLHSNF